jgi:hypothetical protein
MGEVWHQWEEKRRPSVVGVCGVGRPAHSAGSRSAQVSDLAGAADRRSAQVSDLADLIDRQVSIDGEVDGALMKEVRQGRMSWVRSGTSGKKRGDLRSWGSAGSGDPRTAQCGVMGGVWHQWEDPRTRAAQSGDLRTAQYYLG